MTIMLKQSYTYHSVELVTLNFLIIPGIYGKHFARPTQLIQYLLFFAQAVNFFVKLRPSVFWDSIHSFCASPETS
jgi:hypothetical protein